MNRRRPARRRLNHPYALIGLGARKIDVALADSVISAGPARDEDPLPVPLRPCKRLKTWRAGEIGGHVFRSFNRKRKSPGYTGGASFQGNTKNTTGDGQYSATPASFHANCCLSLLKC